MFRVLKKARWLPERSKALITNFPLDDIATGTPAGTQPSDFDDVWTVGVGARWSCARKLAACRRCRAQPYRRPKSGSPGAAPRVSPRKPPLTALAGTIPRHCRSDLHNHRVSACAESCRRRRSHPHELARGARENVRPRGNAGHPGPVMVRHSAAHRGAEGSVFPAAVRRGIPILTFNNTCYGRLLNGAEPIEPADCYRYSLSQLGVSACISAPATLEQLAQNLTAMQNPELTPERHERLLRQGEVVYRNDKIFRKLIRER